MTDEQIRDSVMRAWIRMGIAAVKIHCGGRGLVAGCPVCGKRWGK